MILRKRMLVPSILLIVGLLLSGCNLTAQPPAAPTEDPAALQATVAAAVAQVIEATGAALTSTAAVIPTSTFTETATLEPTATETATATVYVAPPTATNTYIPPTPKPSMTPTPKTYACSLISTSPNSGTKYAANTDFDVAWKIKNTGSHAWEVGYVDLQFVSGTKMQTKGDVYDVAVALARDAEHTILIDMKTPATVGVYTATFALVMEGITMCTLPVTIEVIP